MPRLRTATDPSWIDVVLSDFDAFLVDHAACERKASATALKLVSHYSDRTLLVRELIPFAQEELEHYAQVMTIILDRGLSTRADEKDPYVGALMRLIQRGPEQYFLDRLLVLGIVEARGCERFGMIADALEPGAAQRLLRGHHPFRGQAPRLVRPPRARILSCGTRPGSAGRVARRRGWDHRSATVACGCSLTAFSSTPGPMRKVLGLGTPALAFGFLLMSCSSDGGSSTTGPDGGVSDPEYDAAGPAAVGVLTTAATDSDRGADASGRSLVPDRVLGYRVRRHRLRNRARPASGAVWSIGRRARGLRRQDDDGHPRRCRKHRGVPARSLLALLHLHALVCACRHGTSGVPRLHRRRPGPHRRHALRSSRRERPAPLNNELVDVREADIRFLIDRVLAGDVLPDGVTANAAQLGMLGHSIGSVTAGKVAENDSRIAAVVGLAAPMENILYGEVSIEAIDVPLGLLVATEDNSITEAGNLFIRENFSKANTPAYKMEIVDAGHWSVTNIAGLEEFFAPGCGDGLRQTNGEPFTTSRSTRRTDTALPSSPRFSLATC